MNLLKFIHQGSFLTVPSIGKAQILLIPKHMPHTLRSTDKVTGHGHENTWAPSHFFKRHEHFGYTLTIEYVQLDLS